jgi:hypothetical protein
MEKSIPPFWWCGEVLRGKQKTNKYSRRAVALRMPFQQAMKLPDLFCVTSADLHAEPCLILKLNLNLTTHYEVQSFA